MTDDRTTKTRRRRRTLGQDVWGDRTPPVIRDLDRTLTTGLQFVGDLHILARRVAPWLRGARASERQAPVVLVHGYGADVGSLHFVARLLRNDGFEVYHVSLNTVERPVEALGQELARKIEEIREVTGHRRVDLIGHSLGGLVIRYYVQMCAGWKYVSHVITLGTPHRGGTYAIHLIAPLRYLGLYPAPIEDGSTKQLRPGSEFLRRLNSKTYRVRNLRKVDFTAVWSLADAAVLPFWNGYFPHGRNRVLFIKGHVWMILSSSVYDLLKRILLRPASGGKSDDD
ncbi:MAG: alpha/beta fold hydrolase [Myxococcales bacterium]|nr:alpha/beta fold hydrolase [Myxococcales bacterium]